jgi:hypothetical protein
MALTSTQQVALNKVAQSFGQSTPNSAQTAAAQNLQSSFAGNSPTTLQKAPVGNLPVLQGQTQNDGTVKWMPTQSAISATSLSSPQAPINLPSARGSIGGAGLGSTGGTLAGNNAGLEGLLSPLGYTQDANGLFTYKAPATNAQDPQSLDSLMASLIPKQESVLNSSEVQNQNQVIEQKRQAAQTYTNQLNSVIAKSQADILSTQGQGRGIPEAIIGGQQAQINREAAIQALPIQAALSAAQGDLSMAQDHLKQLVDIKTEEVQNTFQYKMNYYNAVKEVATKKQAAQIDALEKKATQENALQTNNLDYAQTLATSAFNNGQAQIGASLMKLMSNPASPTFMNDVARYAGQIIDPNVALDTQLKQAQISSANRANQPSVAGTTGATTLTGKPQTQAQVIAAGYAQRASEADTIISGFGDKFTGLQSYVGQSLPNFLKSSERQQYEQAKRNFVNAVLRPESGAVISEQEFKNADKQYFPQPGDGQAVIAQKATNRQTKISSLYSAGNVAQQATPGSVIEDADGKRYTVGADGETLTAI